MVRKLARSALAVVLAAALLCTIIFQGRDFLWCPIMHEARQACCCPAPDHEQPGPAISRPGCCEPKSVPTASDASPSSERMGPLVAIVVAFEAIPIAGDPPARIAASNLPCPTLLRHATSPPPRGPPFVLNCAYLI